MTVCTYKPHMAVTRLPPECLCLIDAAAAEPAWAQTCRILRVALGGHHWRVHRSGPFTVPRLRLCLPSWWLDRVAAAVRTVVWHLQPPGESDPRSLCGWATLARAALRCNGDVWLRHCPRLERFVVITPCRTEVGILVGDDGRRRPHLDARSCLHCQPRCVYLHLWHPHWSDWLWLSYERAASDEERTLLVHQVRELLVPFPRSELPCPLAEAVERLGPAVLFG